MRSITTADRPKGRRAWASALLPLVLTLGVLTAAAPALARGSFDGGPLSADTATVVANDHTATAVRFSATTGGTYPLAKNTTYYVKLRYTVNADGSPSSGSNRGFTWNPTTGLWVDQGEDWLSFPTVTTDGNGAIPLSEWFFVKFGDTTMTGPYYLIVSLSTGVSGTTLNGTVFVPVTVIDMTTGGAWVHSGADTAQAGGTRADVVDHAAAGSPVSTEVTKPNGCDDDGNGVVDDEVYGPVQTGGFRMAVPLTQTLDARLAGAVWPAASEGFAATVADTDVALGAADQLPPSAPGAVTAAPRDGAVVLSWGAATDAEGVAAYNVYRWGVEPLGLGYTAEPVKVATVTGVTTCTDTDLTNGTTYHYLVRAVDAATNVGPRSETTAATPDGTPPAAVTSFAAVVSAQSVHLTWKPPVDADLAGVKILRTTVAPPTGPDDPAAAVVYDGVGTSCNDPGLDSGTKYHYAAYAYDTAANYSAVARVDATTAKLAVKIGRPVAPATVKHRKAFTVYGSLAPQQPAGATSVKLRCYLKKNSKWVLKKTVATKNADHGLATRYSVSLSLPTAGRWKLVAACGATAQYRAATSTPEYLKVK